MFMKKTLTDVSRRSTSRYPTTASRESKQIFDNSAPGMETMPAVYCSYTTLEPTASLIENPRNPNKHPEEQIIALAKIIRHQGWRNPIVVSKRSGFVIKGHGRLLAARMLGLEEVPVDMQDYENEAAELADMIADNKIAELSNIDEGELTSLLRELDGQIDLELTGFAGRELTDILAQAEDIGDVPDAVDLGAENPSTAEVLPSLSYGAKHIFLQPDEAARFERFLEKFSDKHGNYNGLCLELLENGDSRFRNA